MNTSTKGILLVAVQIITIGLLALTGKILDFSWVVLPQAVGIGIGVWAMAAMRFRFRVLPEVAPSQQLVTAGPYHYIRHPMYLALLLITLAWVAARPSLISVGIWLVLAADLLIKLHYEEQQLTQRFPAYRQYQQTTKKLLPFMY